MNDGKKITSTSSNEAVSINDVRTVLQETTNDLASLCRSSKINMWARYKPIAISASSDYNLPTPITYATRKNNKFGISIYINRDFSTLNAIYEDIITNEKLNNGWTYTKPGTNQYCRLTDFQCYNDNSDSGDPYLNNHIGYNHRANLPCFVTLQDTGLFWKEENNSYEINVSDVNNYFTINLKNSDGNDLHIQDIVNMDFPSTGNFAWHLILEICTNNWNSTVIEKVGDTITTNNNSWNVQLSLSELNSLKNNAENNDGYHLCLGLGYCEVNSDGTPNFDGSPAGDDCILPLPCQGHFKIKVVDHVPQMNFVQLLGVYYFNSQNQLTLAQNNNIPRSTSSGTKFILKFKINDDQQHRIFHFINPELPEAIEFDQNANHTPFQLGITKEGVNDLPNRYIINLTPCQPNGITKERNAIIDTTDENSYVYAMFPAQGKGGIDISDLDLTNGGGTYHLFSRNTESTTDQQGWTLSGNIIINYN